MATFLILAKELINVGQVEGDTISVKGDDDTVTTPSGTWHWSAEEDINRWVAEGNPRGLFPNLFYVLDVSGMSLEKAQRILHFHERPAVLGVDSEAEAPDISDRKVFLGPSRWNYDIPNKMTPAERQSIRRNKSLSVARGRVNDIVTDRAGLDVFDTDDPINLTLLADPVGDSVRGSLSG